MNKTAVSNPGSGTYNPENEKNSTFQAAPSYGLGTAKRTEMASSALKQNPGPGNY
jgi:hypothetical protein